MTPEHSRTQLQRVRLGGLAKWLALTQLIFNVGFYLVMPFLALHLQEDLGLSPWLIGLVIGARTFSQQGLFILGGVIADRLGPRPTVVLGCVLRIFGFVLLGISGGLTGILMGAILTGVAGALFSPAVEACLATILAEGREAEEAQERRRRGFAVFAVAGEIGAMTGPLIGLLALDLGFRTSCLVAAAVFAIITVVHARWLPRGAAHPEDSLANGLSAMLRNRVFVFFAVAHSTYLLAYNQLYFLVPDSLAGDVGADRGAQATAIFMTAASVLIAAAQMPWARWVGRLPLTAVFGLGFSLISAGAVVAAMSGLVSDHSSIPWWAGPAGFVVLLTLGQMTVNPHAAIAAASLSREQHLGAHLGALATAGGIAAMAGTPVLGWLGQQVSPVAAWCALASLALLSAIILPVLLRRRDQTAAA